MTMSSTMRNVRMHYYTDATAASVPRSTLEVLVTWIWHVTFCGPTGGGKWSQQTQRSILTREVHNFKSDWDFHRFASVVSWLIGCVYFAANLVRVRVISLNDFQSSRRKLKFVTDHLSSCYENSENMTFFKILKFEKIENFEKIDLIIWANGSNRSNCKKSQHRLDRFIGQRINSQSTTFLFGQNRES